MHTLQYLLIPAALLCSVAMTTRGISAEEIEVKSVIISLIDQVKVASEEAGVWQEVLVRPGQVVRKGDLIGKLDHTDAKLALERVEYEADITAEQANTLIHLQLAEKALGITTAELSRAEESNAKFLGAVTVTELDRLRLARDQAQLEIEQARHEGLLNKLRLELKKSEVNIARHNLERRTLLAPLDGMVTKVEHQVGEWVQPGEMFCEIILTTQVRAEGFLSVEQGDVEQGDAVSVSLPGVTEQREFRGVITFIDPQIDPITSQYRVWAIIENTDGMLRPGHKPKMWVSQNSSPAVSSSEK